MTTPKYTEQTISVLDLSPHDDPLRRRWLRQDFPVLPKKLATNLSRKVLKWLYSFSLIILLIIAFAFVIVTPLDIIMQTASKNAAAVKLFIIIAACTLFLFVAILFYFSRLYRSRVLFNRIPAKSAYIPLEKNDLLPSVLNYIHKTLQYCVGEVKEKTGPLANKKELFHYPGRVPPKYIQTRNIELGLLSDYFVLPEEHTFQDMVDSVGLKLRLDGMFAHTYSIPKDMTFREIIVSVFPLAHENSAVPHNLARAAHRAISTYERVKFSGELVGIEEIIEFFVDLEKIFMNCYSSTPDVFTDNFQDRMRNSSDLERPVMFQALSLQKKNEHLLIQDSIERGRDNGDMSWTLDPRDSIGSAEGRRDSAVVAEDTPSNAAQRAMYSQVGPHMSLTSSVLRVPPSQASSQPRNNWDSISGSQRFSSKNYQT